MSPTEVSDWARGACEDRRRVSWVRSPGDVRSKSSVSAESAERKLSLAVLSSSHWPRLRRVAARIATAPDFVQAEQNVRVDVAML